MKKIEWDYIVGIGCAALLVLAMLALVALPCWVVWDLGSKALGGS